MSRWGILWRSNNRLDGARSFLMGRFTVNRVVDCPAYLQGYSIMVFKTRQQARDYISEKYGYIRRRPDLRREPHGWKTPIPVKVSVEVKIVT